MKTPTKSLITLTFLTFVSACGGGGGEPTNTTPAPNVAPIASASAPSNVAGNTPVDLNGSSSHDPDGSIVTYLWTQTAGSEVSITNPNQAITAITTPTIEADTSLDFQLMVTDDKGLSSTASVTILVVAEEESPTNQLPIVSAGINQTVEWGNEVSLSGSASDSDGAITSYAWVQSSGTNITIINSNLDSPSFVAPSSDSTINLELTVTDDDGGQSTDTVSISVVEGSSSSASDLLWSNITSWYGKVPSANDSISIPEGVTVTIDVSDITIADLTINGVVRFARQDISLTTDWIMVHGELHIGSAAQPYTHNAVLSFKGNRSQDEMGHGSRGLFIHNGVLELHGSAPQTTWTQISDHINAGENSFNVLENSDWKSGDEIVIAPTDYYQNGASQLLTINGVSNNQVNINETVSQFHWGKLQYATSNGMSLTPDLSINAANRTPLILDERAEVGNLTRNIKIQSVNDSLWNNDGFGAHVMVMGLSSVVHVDGVEFFRVGQAGLMARYPFHWHRLSYSDDGTELGDPIGHYLKNSSIHNSKNRCVTIHGTNGVEIKNNICYNILGHAIFFEDAVERRNTVENNLILGVRAPTNANTLLLHDSSQGKAGPSGIWVTNPDNTIRNNVIADSEGSGLWLAFPDHTLGLNKNVDMQPNRLVFGNFNGNTVHSNKSNGVMFDHPPIDDEGRTVNLKYGSGSNQEDYNCSVAGLQRLVIADSKLWKNTKNQWENVHCASFVSFISADSGGSFFSGAGDDGIISTSLLVGSSLNASTHPAPWVGPATAFATYHSTFSMTDNVLVNFPLVEGKTSGAFASDDYYFRAIEKGHIFNRDNILINTDGGHRSDVLVDEHISSNKAIGAGYFKFSGALLDANGLWGPVNNWSVYDIPFFTHDSNCETILPLSENATSCDGTYFGVSSFIINQRNEQWTSTYEIQVNRLDKNNLSNIVGSWHIDEANSSMMLYNMRHFAASIDGVYHLSFPAEPIPNDLSFKLENLMSQGDNFVLAVDFNGNIDAKVYSSTDFNFESDSHANSPSSNIKHDYTEVNSFEELNNSSGETFWQDNNNNMVWIKFSYTNIEQVSPLDENSSTHKKERHFYNSTNVRIW